MYDVEKDLLFLPLGGSGEIGMNLNLYALDGQWIMVDLGMTFGDPFFPGVDLIFPDPSFIEERQKDLLGIVLTHAHEDHIGAVPYLWRRMRCPIYATPFTAVMVERKLEEAGLLDQVELHVIDIEKTLKLGPFAITYVPLAHSIAEGNALKIETRHGTIFHTGDWKLDSRPIIGNPTPGTELAKIGDKGVLAMVGDSTNVFNPEASGSEGDVQDNLVRIIKGLKGRVVVTTFASNVARLESVMQAARESGRHVALLGRSMHRIVATARETGYLQNFPPLLEASEIAELDRDKVLILCTGCQGEANAALSRIAADEHRDINLTRGDNVLFSSKQIPGNELGIGRLINKLVALGVEIITEKDEFIHVSGHPGKPELTDMYSWIRPEIAIPVHGEVRHIHEHAKLAKSMDVKHVFEVKNGKIIKLAPGKPEFVDEVAVGRLALDGDRLIPIDDGTLAARRRLSREGTLVLSAAINRKGRLSSDIVIAADGVPAWEENDMLYDAVLNIAERMLEGMHVKKAAELSTVEEEIRIRVRRYMKTHTGKRPLVSVMLLQTD